MTVILHSSGVQSWAGRRSGTGQGRIRGRSRTGATGLACALTLTATGAAAEDVTGTPDRNATLLAGATPPPTNVAYLQYGVSFTAEVASSPGPMCDDALAPELA